LISFPTDESFTNNFSDKGNFDFSVQSLRKGDDILEELCEAYSKDEPTAIDDREHEPNDTIFERP
jgi:hypothetical protein